MRRPRVLIADDDDSVRRALSHRLEQAGFDVAACSDGYTAALMLDAQAPDLVILDINMPAGNGFTVHRHMRRSERCRRVPVIFITGEAHDDILHNARARGPAAVLKKPYEARDLFAAINQCMRTPAA